MLHISGKNVAELSNPSKVQIARSRGDIAIPSPHAVQLPVLRNPASLFSCATPPPLAPWDLKPRPLGVAAFMHRYQVCSLWNPSWRAPDSNGSRDGLRARFWEVFGPKMGSPNSDFSESNSNFNSRSSCNSDRNSRSVSQPEEFSVAGEGSADPSPPPSFLDLHYP